MQNIFDIHDYDEGFLERFTSQTIPIYDLWSVRPLQNEQKELISGGSDDADKFRDFIIDHSNQEFPHPLVIVIGNAEKTNKGRMSNTSKKYFKLKFEKFKGTDLGTPLTLSGTPQAYPTNDTAPMVFNGMPQANRSQNPNNPLQGFSLGDIHGIIDRNVSDATRSIRAEYEEQSAKREAENIKRMAELETRMEMYKLDIRAKEVDDREQELKRDLEQFEQQKIEGLGTVKDYTKTIAGGILEFGKVALGLEDDKIKTKTEIKNKAESNIEIKGFDNDGFQEIKNAKLTLKNEENNLDVILQGISNLDDEQKEALLEAILTSDESHSNKQNITEITNKEHTETIENTDTSGLKGSNGNKQITNQSIKEQQTENN